jgi:hypothetical protein
LLDSAGPSLPVAGDQCPAMRQYTLCCHVCICTLFIITTYLQCI